jgi:hypothetical protein
MAGEGIPEEKIAEYPMVFYERDPSIFPFLI